MGDSATPLDSLKIIVKGENEDAVKKIDALISKLTSISQATQNTNKGLNSYSNAMKKLSTAMSNVDGDKISTMANALSRLSNLNNVKISSTIPKRISEIGAAVENVDVSKVDKLVQSLGGLQGLGALSGASLSSMTPAPVTAPAVDNNFGGTVEMPGGAQTVEVENTTAAVEEQIATVERNSQSWARLQAIATKAASGLKVAAIGAAKGVDDFAKNLALAPFKSFSAKIEKASGAISNLGKVIKKRVLYRLINAAISAITKSFKEGTNNIYQYSKALGTAFAPDMDKIATSALYLKNALGSLVAPLVNAVAPAIDFVIDKFVDLLNVVSQTIAKLTGASVWSKAVKYPTTYADAADKATAANKKFKASLLGIDEINKLNDNSDNGGGAGGNNLDYSKMFTETPVDAVSKLGDIFKPIKDSYDKNVAPMKAKVEKALGNIKKLIGDVGKSFSEVWQNGTGTETFDHIFGILGGCVELAGNLAAKLDEAWTANGNGTAQLQSIWNIYNSILGIVDDLVNDTAEWVNTLNFTPISNSVTKFLGTLDESFKLIRESFQLVNTEVLQPLSKWTIEEAAPASLNVLSEAFNVCKSAATILKDNFSSVKEALAPIVSFFGKTFTDTMNFLSNTFHKVSVSISQDSSTLGSIIQSISSIIKSVWATVEPLLKTIWSVVKNLLNTVGEYLKSKLSFFANLFSGLLQLIDGLMTFDLSKIWSGVKTTFNAFVDEIKNKLIEGYNTAVNILNSIIDVVGGVTNSVLGLLNNILGTDYHVDAAKEHIAHLGAKGGGGRAFAGGGFPTAGEMFIARENGLPELVGTIGNRTAVANNEQIVEGIADGVADANREQNSILQQGIELLRIIAENSNSNGGNIDIFAEISRRNRQDGTTIIPMGV